MPSDLAPSIFNDVLGPVMRGPSSSHSAASVRIARLARDLAGGNITRALIEFDPNGSLATTHESQGSDLGLYGGLLGWEADDPRLPEGKAALAEASIEVDIQINDIAATHPNTYRLTVVDGSDATYVIEADSLGGGMMVVNQIDGHAVELHGDYQTTLLKGVASEKWSMIESNISGFSKLEQAGDWLVCEACEFLSRDLIAQLGATESRFLERVLPIPSFPGMELPFEHAGQIMQLPDNPGQHPLSRWALEYETARSGWSDVKVLKMMASIRDIMRGGVEKGLQGTQWKDRILGNQSKGYRAAMESGKLLEGGMLNRMVLYVTALMEAKSAMEVIVAAPTAGSCGTFPATSLAAADAIKI